MFVVERAVLDDAAHTATGGFLGAFEGAADGGATELGAAAHGFDPAMLADTQTLEYPLFTVFVLITAEKGPTHTARDQVVAARALLVDQILADNGHVWVYMNPLAVVKIRVL